MKPNSSAHEDSTISILGRGAGPALRRGDAPYFLVIEQGSSSVFLIPSKPEVIIGRGLDADLQCQHASVSRKHARLTWQEDALYVHDLGSHNGVLVNGTRISGSQPVYSRDVVSVGEVLLVLHRGAASSQVGPLLDRVSVRQQLFDEVERALRYQHSLVVMHIALGITSSDLIMLAAAFAQHLRPLARIALLSESELVVVLPDYEDEELLDLLPRLLRELPPQARIGHCACPDDGCDTDILFLLARQAAAAAAPGSANSAANIPVHKKIGPHEILISEPAMLRTYDLIARLGSGSISVLIRGETGSGKELAAAALHHHSSRSTRRFLAINCAALPDALAESELFGHERGAFSGAVATKIGLLESAQGGTVFLDEIGDLSLSIQAKLLRALETQRIIRVGSVEERHIDVRLVAATHRDLEADARAGRFRQDLFFRLAAAVISIPPLRHRPLELPLLARAFLQASRRRLGLSPITLTGSVMARLLSYPWPGNVRELKNDMEFLATTVTEGPIETWHLPAKLGGPSSVASPREQVSASAQSPPDEAAMQFRPLEAELRELERKRILEALKVADGSQTRAAELLGMPRRTFFAKTKHYGLTPRFVLASAEANDDTQSRRSGPSL